jgi:hypothetical protein
MKKTIFFGLVSLLSVVTMTQANIYRARGIGYLGGNESYPLTQRQIMAREAAIMDAQKSLLAQISSFKLSSDSKVEDKVLSSEEISRSIEGVLRDARIESEKQLGKVAYEVTMIYGNEKRIKKSARKAASAIAIKSKMPLEVHPGVYDTGLDLTPGADTPDPMGPSEVPAILRAKTMPQVRFQPEVNDRVEQQGSDEKIPDWLKLYEDEPSAQSHGADEGIKDQVKDLKRRMKLRDETIESLRKTLKK